MPGFQRLTKDAPVAVEFACPRMRNHWAYHNKAAEIRLEAGCMFQQVQDAVDAPALPGYQFLKINQFMSQLCEVIPMMQL